MTRVRQAWKAVVAFLAPGVLLLLEPVARGGDVDGADWRRALIVAAATSLLVYVKRNGASPDPTTSTPEHDAGYLTPAGAWFCIGVLVLVVVACILGTALG